MLIYYTKNIDYVHSLISLGFTAKPLKQIFSVDGGKKDASPFCHACYTALSSFESSTLPFTPSSVCPEDIFVSSWSHPLVPVFLCRSKHICLSFISPWSDSDNAESVSVTQCVLTVCLDGITPHAHLCLIYFYFSDKLIALPLLNNSNIIDLPSVAALAVRYG